VSALDKVHIKHAALSNRIVLARMGKDPNVALDKRDAMSEFWQALVSFSFDGEMPAHGEAVEVSFGGGDEQFTMTLRRNAEPRHDR
jgi:hypothetical protein